MVVPAVRSVVNNAAQALWLGVGALTSADVRTPTLFRSPGWCSYPPVCEFGRKGLSGTRWNDQITRLNELLPPSLDGYGVSFVLMAGRMAGHRGEASTAPHLGRFPPGAGRTGHAGQSGFQPTQQHQSRVLVATTGGTAIQTLVLPVTERFLLVRQFPARTLSQLLLTVGGAPLSVLTHTWAMRPTMSNSREGRNDRPLGECAAHCRPHGRHCRPHGR